MSLQMIAGFMSAWKRPMWTAFAVMIRIWILVPRRGALAQWISYR
jgi:hypothetical protein